MRTINKFFYLLAAVALAGIVSCQKEKEEFKPGEPDSETCEGVYFIKQDVIEETQIFDPTQVKKDTIIVRRSNSDGALTVTPKVSLSEITSSGTVDSDASLFTVSNIEFKDGQEESYVAIEFPNVKEGVQYSLHLSIEGDEFSSKYSSSLKACDYKVMCVAYQTLCGPDKKPALFTFEFGWWEETRTAFIKYYEVDGVRHCVTFDEKLVGTGGEAGKTNGAHEEKGGFWGVDPNQHLAFLWYLEDEEECSDCGEEHPHTIPAGYNAPEGAELITFDGFQEFDFGWGNNPVVVDYYYYQLQGGYARPYLHYVDANGLFDNASYYDGNGGFFFWILGYNTMANRGSGWSFPQDYDIVGIAGEQKDVKDDDPFGTGFIRDDFSIELAAGMPEADDKGDMVVPVSFKVGKDVNMVGYSILPGNPSSAVIASEVVNIAKDTVEFAKKTDPAKNPEKYHATWVEAEGVSFKDMVSTDATGMYTLVAVTVDTVHVKDKVQYAVKASSSVNFKYILPEDMGHVVLNVDANSTEAYASQGWNSDLSLAYTITGVGITGAIPMVYSQAEIEGYGGIDVVVNAIASTPNTYFGYLNNEKFTGKLTPEQLASANDNGFTDIYSSGVTPGTTYYVIVWATDGYDVAVEYDTMTTTGDPLPIYMNYNYTDRADELIDGKKASDFFGTYNLYAIDYYGSASLRSYMGQATLAEYDSEKYGTIQLEEGEEIAQISGLSCGAAGGDFDDTILLDFCENPFGADIPDKKGFFVASKNNLAGTAALYTWVPAGNDWYNWSYFMVAYPVADGYIAFVAESYYADNYGMWANVNFYNDDIDIAFQDFLLVDPAKDDNPHAVSAAISAAKKARRGNKVEVPGNARFNKLEGIEPISAKSPFFTPAGVKGLEPATHLKKVNARHSVIMEPAPAVNWYDLACAPLGIFEYMN